MTVDEKDADFAARRAEARILVNRLDADIVKQQPDRKGFFNSVYDSADSDAAQVPWADLEAKPELTEWLLQYPGNGRLALDIACGLGDNAEALASAGYKTTAFDLSATAIEWAKQRFPSSEVSYQVADLTQPPADWTGRFDLVNECYTLQALPPEMFETIAEAIANTIRPGGTLLVYSRVRTTDQLPDGPPWPITDDQAGIFAKFGFAVVNDHRFVLERPDKSIPHQFCEWRKTL